MKSIRLFIGVAVAVVAASRVAGAAEWVTYEGTVSESAVTTTNEDGGEVQEGLPVCRDENRVGLLVVEYGVCNTVSNRNQLERVDGNFYVLVLSATDVQEWTLYSKDVAESLVSTANQDGDELQEGLPVCRHEVSVGWLDVKSGVCSAVSKELKLKRANKNVYVLKQVIPELEEAPDSE